MFDKFVQINPKKVLQSGRLSAGEGQSLFGQCPNGGGMNVSLSLYPEAFRVAIREKNEIMWGKFPNGGGGSDPNPLLDV